MENNRYFKRHPKTIAKILMILFSILFICGIGIGVGGGLIMSMYSGETLIFWLGILMAMLSVFIVFWTILGFIFNAIDYTNA